MPNNIKKSPQQLCYCEKIIKLTARGSEAAGEWFVAHNGSKIHKLPKYSAKKICLLFLQNDISLTSKELLGKSNNSSYNCTTNVSGK